MFHVEYQICFIRGQEVQMDFLYSPGYIANRCAIRDSFRKIVLLCILRELKNVPRRTLMMNMLCMSYFTVVWWVVFLQALWIICGKLLLFLFPRGTFGRIVPRWLLQMPLICLCALSTWWLIQMFHVEHLKGWKNVSLWNPVEIFGFMTQITNSIDRIVKLYYSKKSQIGSW